MPADPKELLILRKPRSASGYKHVYLISNQRHPSNRRKPFLAHVRKSGLKCGYLGTFHTARKAAFAVVAYLKKKRGVSNTIGG